MTKKSLTKKEFWTPLALSVMLALGMILGYQMNEKEDGHLIKFVRGDDYVPVGQVEQMLRFIETKYVDSIDREVLVEKAIVSVIDELDPHSIYISSDQKKSIAEDMKGSFLGIGVEIFYIDDTVNIIRPVKDGPADLAGIAPFDKLISINDSLVAGRGLKFNDIRKLLSGKLGNDLDLVLVDKEGKQKEVSLTLGSIPVKSVSGGFMLDDKTGYVKIDRFSEKTYREYMEIIEDMAKKHGMKNIVIDLRGNPGGYLPQVIKILCQLFNEKDRLLVYTKGKNDKKYEYKSTGKVFFPIDKIAVLIDEESASGSEIIAGAIQDWDRGVIIGRRSFGKGLVQEQYDLSNGGAFRITVARYYTPTGRCIQRNYTNKDAYYHDIESRYEHGEFFVKDSIPHNEKKRFKTLMMNRPVYGGGGITPDIFIAEDSILYDPEFREIKDQLPRFVFKRLFYHQDIQDVDSMADIILKEFLNNIDKKTSNFSFNKIKPLLREMVLENVIRYSTSDTAADKHLMVQDPAVKEALKYFDSSGKLTDFIKITPARK